NLLLVQFTLAEPLDEDVTFDYSLVEGTAKAGVDYKGQTGNITIAAGFKLAQLFITTKDNTDVQNDTQFLLEISKLSENATSSHSQTIVSIVNKVPDPIVDNTPELSFSSEMSVNEGDLLLVKFTLAEPLDEDVTFDYSLVEKTAKKGTDYFDKAGSITIASGSTSAQLFITTTENTAVQNDTQFLLEISDIQGAKTSHKQMIISILNEILELTFDNTHQVLEGGQVEITLTLSQTVQRRIKIDYETADNTAKADVDYQKVENGVIYLEPGELSTIINLTTLTHGESHDDSSFYFRVTDVVGAIKASSESLIEITNNEPKISFHNYFSVKEGDSAVIEFSISEPNNNKITIWYETEGGSAENNVDFTQHASTELNIINSFDKNGQEVYKTRLSLETLNRNGIQGERDFYFKITKVVGATIDIEQARIMITDVIEISRIGFDESETQASYQTGDLLISVTKSKVSTEELRVPFELTGTAVIGQDYTLAGNNEVVFAANSTTATIEVNVIDNGLPRSGSTIEVLLKAVGDNEIDQNKSSHTVVLTGGLALNDTGSVTGTDNDDANYGRDSDADLKDNNEDGLAGFSFSKLDYQGNKVSDDNNSFACVKDNVTGFVYEGKQQANLIAYNAKLSDDEISQLNQSLANVTYQKVYDTFTFTDNDGNTVSDFTNITGRDWERISASDKERPAFKKLTELSTNEFTFLL
ncbi:MAG: hypothetical protein JJV99_06035, partial [Colwellia sp.]|nr:hypothetical protein [Colwellia sp.]